MFDGVSDGARDRPPLPVKWGGGAAEPSEMLVTSAQRVSFLVGSFLQLPHRGPAPSGSPCWATVFALFRCPHCSGLLLSLGSSALIVSYRIVS